MFQSRYEHTIDNKGRVSLPSKFRDTLSTFFDERLMVTNYFGGCLIAMPYTEWKNFENKINELPLLDAKAVALRRFFISGVAECRIDGNGRILIPPVLRDYAGLTGPVCINGMGKYIEIWARDKWEESFQNARNMLEKISSELAEMGLVI